MDRLFVTVIIIAGLVACNPEDESNDAGVETRMSEAASGIDSVKSQLDAAIAGRWREPANVARDHWRNPAQTLSFFGVNSDQTVIEIIPAGGWYTEILAPFLRKHGHYIAAVINPATAINSASRCYYLKQIKTLKRKLAVSRKIYGTPEVRYFDEGNPVFGAPGSADMVVTFRNVHNWRNVDTVEKMFQGFFDVLKSGGTLGLVEHRAKVDGGAYDNPGYIRQDQVIAWAIAAGFVLE